MSRAAGVRTSSRVFTHSMFVTDEVTVGVDDVPVPPSGLNWAKTRG